MVKGRKKKRLQIEAFSFQVDPEGLEPPAL